jgi:hypothetical protein
MHLEPETDYNYMMEENMIANTMEEKDLAIIIDNKLNFQNHINKQVNKANNTLPCGIPLVTSVHDEL